MIIIVIIIVSTFIGVLMQIINAAWRDGAIFWHQMHDRPGQVVYKLRLVIVAATIIATVPQNCIIHPVIKQYNLPPAEASCCW